MIWFDLSADICPHGNMAPNQLAYSLREISWKKKMISCCLMTVLQYGWFGSCMATVKP